MAAIIANAAEILLNDIIKNSMAGTATAATWKLVLFTDSMFTPSATMVWGDISGSIATFAGYADVTLTMAAAATVSGWGVSDMGTATFTRSTTGSSQTVYGWALIADVAMTVTLIAAEVLATPRVFTNAGDAEQFAVKFRSNSAN